MFADVHTDQSDGRDTEKTFHIVSGTGKQMFLDGTFVVNVDNEGFRLEDEIGFSPTPLVDDVDAESPFDVSEEFIKYTVHSDGSVEKRVGNRVYNPDGKNLGFVYSRTNYDGGEVVAVDVFDDTQASDDQISEEVEFLEYCEFDDLVEAADALYVAHGGNGIFSHRTFVDVALPGL